MAELDRDKIIGLMKMMGGASVNEEQMNVLGQLTEQYADKSQEEILIELSQLSEMMAADKARYKRQLNMLQQMRDFLNPEQQQRLDYLMGILNPQDDKDS